MKNENLKGCREDAPSSDYMSKHEILDLQNSKLNEIMPYIANVPFYKNKLLNEGVNIKEICAISDLTKLPFTTKEDLRTTNPMERTSHNFDGVAFLFSSSGTTGVPSVYPWSTNDELVLRKVAARCMKRVGVGPGDIALVVAPFGMSIMWYCMINQYLAAGAGVVPLGTGPPDFIIGAMNSFPITAVTTLPVIATRSIEFLKSSGTSLVSNRLRHFHFGGDYLSNARRRRVEKYFGVQCYDFYGLSEIFGPIAGECEEKNGLHVASDYVLVEVVNPHTKEHVREGEVGVAVYTTLWTKAAPLLRFWSDDYVSVTWDKCKCGRTSPRIRYEGRPASGVIIRNRWIFAKNIEEIVMSFPECSNEFEIKIQGTIEKPTAKLYLEDSSHKIPIEEIEDNLEEFLGIPVKTEIVDTGFFSRENVKQGIITDTRLLSASK